MRVDLRLRTRVLASLMAGGIALAAARADSLAQFSTPLGDVLIQLYDPDKPVTVQNFKRYVTEGLFRDSFVQRWEPGFVIQGGGYFVTNRTSASPKIATVPTHASIANEFSVGRRCSNVYGTIAMARVGGQTNSATSQWFINLASNVSLDAVDGGFTVFGHTLLGTNVLNRFNSTATTNGIFALNLGGALYQMPVLSSSGATYEDIIYTQISLPAWPQIHIERLADGARRIRWNSLSNFVNRVEGAADLTASWQSLNEVQGTGGEMTWTDVSAGTRRFYRVRVD